MTAGAVVDSRIIRTVAEHAEWHSIDHATCNRCIYCQRYLDEERRFREAVAQFHANAALPQTAVRAHAAVTGSHSMTLWEDL